MIFSRYIRTKATRLLTAAVIAAGGAGAVLLHGCAADDFDALRTPSQYDSDTQLVITLAIPQGEQLPVVATRADVPTEGPEHPDPSQSATENELKINSLRLYIFPYNNAEAAPIINRPLLIPSQMPVNPDNSVTYEVGGLEKGTDYRFYILANFGDEVTGFTKSSALEAAIIDYTSAQHNLVPGNLPMVYKSSAPIKILPEATAPVHQTLALQYACVKLRYNFIFDNSDETHKIDGKSAKDNFGSNKLTPESVALTNVTKTSKIVWNNTPSFYTASDNTVATAALSGFSFYPDWTHSETPTSGDRSNVSYEYTVRGSVFADAAAAGNADKWILQGTTYVPERYVEDKKDQMGIILKSKFNGSVSCEHPSTIGVDDQLALHRGYCYEFTGHIVNTGMNGIIYDCEVLDWQGETINTDFVSTFLTLSSTDTYVDSFENGEIIYDTDGRGQIGFECGEDAQVKIDNVTYDLFELAPVTADTQNTLQIRVNSNVTITKLPSDFPLKNDTGVACYITAGNIKKQILVKYNIEPFFTITPTSLKIQKGDGISNDSRYFEYRTNMGGFILKSTNCLTNYEFECSDATKSEKTTYEMIAGDDNVGYPNVGLELSDDSTPSGGRIKVSYVIPKTTLVYEFEVESKEAYNGEKETASLQIEVMPDKDKYRIYFRAINDYQASDNNEFLHDNSYTLPVEYVGTGNNNSNWIDYWSLENDSRNKTTPTSDHHRLYAYTQYGQDANTQPVWLYTAPYYGKDPDWQEGYSQWWEFDYGGSYGSKSADMTADDNNPGWYYYDIPVKCTGVPYKGAATHTLKDKYGNGPLPGATLLIFYNPENDGQSRHRVNQADAPGIPLGDDNDNETWVLYDPSREPVYMVYNDKPVIEDVTYTIYSDMAFTAWRHDYGKNNIHGTVGNAMKEVSSDQSGYHKYTISLKAAKGEYDREIYLGTQRNSPVVAVGLYNVDLSDWGSPLALFSISGKPEVYKEMTLIPGQTQEYYVKVPEGYESGQVKFCSWDRTLWCDNGGGGYTTPSTNIVKMTWTNNTGNWSQNDSKVPTLYDILMFNGRNWTTGYYKNGVWNKNP